ncbi:hypothetical protein EV361DRAFT_812609, partial [Lentinula raphanica]
VLHPLLMKTQLCTISCPQILYMLKFLIRMSNICDVNPTTKRLVERCQGGEWCVGFIRQKQIKEAQCMNLNNGATQQQSSADPSSTSLLHKHNRYSLKAPGISKSNVRSSRYIRRSSHEVQVIGEVTEINNLSDS